MEEAVESDGTFAAISWRQTRFLKSHSCWVRGQGSGSVSDDVHLRHIQETGGSLLRNKKQHVQWCVQELQLPAAHCSTSPRVSGCFKESPGITSTSQEFPEVSTEQDQNSLTRSTGSYASSTSCLGRLKPRGLTGTERGLGEQNRSRFPAE